MFSPCVFVCLFVCVCVYVCHDVCPDDLTMKDWCNTNNILQVHCWRCLVVQGMFHALMTSLMTSQGDKVGQSFEIDIYPSIFALERQSKAQNVGNTNGYLSGMFNFRYNFRWKSLSRAQNGDHFENFEILNTASIWHQIWKDRPKLCQKRIFHDNDVIDDVIGWPQIRPSTFLYKWNNNIFHDN